MKGVTIPCNDCRFHQSLPLPVEDLVLLQGSKRTNNLLYQDNTTDKQYLVPNIWYNQPVDWRIEAIQWSADRAADKAAVIRAEKDRFWEGSYRDMVALSKRLQVMADEMKRTRKVIA